MTTGLDALDWTLLGIFLAATVVLGTWAGRRQPGSEDFFFAGRSLPSWPLGLSLAVAGMTVVFYGSGPGEAYWVGMKLVLVPVLVWTALPLVSWCIIPLYGHLRLDSVYEYLELRFDAATRAVAGGVYLLGTLFWLGGVLALPVRVVQLGAGVNGVSLVLLVTIGGAVALYTYLGGMRATVWTDVLQVVVMAVALVVLISAVTAQLPQRQPSVRQVAEQLGRTRVVDFAPDRPAEWVAASDRWSVFSRSWSIWAVVPYLALMPLFFFTADQATLQRLLSARNRRAGEFSYLLGCGLFTLMVPAVMYVGMGLLVVYHENPQAEIPPAWVADSATDRATGTPRIGPGTTIDADNIEQLVTEEWILDPNTNQPFTDRESFEPAELINERGEVIVDRLSTRAPRKWGGERLLRCGGDHLLAHFARRHLPLWLVFVALAAAAMATIDSGINSLATLAVVDFHRRHGWAERWLARTCRKLPDELDQSDELRLGRPLVLVFGAMVIIISLAVFQLADVTAYLFGVLNLFAGPLLGVFLLGLFTRRTTGPAVLAAMVLGVVTALWATLGHHLTASSPLAVLWPFAGPLGIFWPLLFALAATLSAGYLLSFLIGSRKTRTELSGLVAGLGRWGVLLETEDKKEKEEVYWIEIDDEETPQQSPWS